MEYKREKYLNKLIELERVPIIKVITGLRRCGKSYLLNNIFYRYLINKGIKSDHIIKIEFDKKENAIYRDADFCLKYLKEVIVDNDTYYYLLDEVQLIKDKNDPNNKSSFFEVLNSLLHIENTNIYVTGSNSQFLSKDILTTFRGRGFNIHILPLSFSEIMEDESLSMEEAFDNYLTYGGLPLTYTYATDELKSTYLNSIFDEIYEEDLKSRYNIKNKIEFDELIDICSSQIGSYCSYKSLSNTFKSVKNKSIKNETIAKYMGYMESAFIVSGARKYNIKGKHYIDAYKKYYFEDLGLRNARLNFRQVEKTHLLENLIYNELKYRGYDIDVGSVEKVEKDTNNKSIKKQLEIDFICNKASQKYYIQSAYSLYNNDSKLEQEKRSLLALKDAFKRIIITYDKVKPHKDEDGILILNIFDFLLDPNSLEI